LQQFPLLKGARGIGWERESFEKIPSLPFTKGEWLSFGSLLVIEKNWSYLGDMAFFYEYCI
jgi:hypothetical protein